MAEAGTKRVSPKPVLILGLCLAAAVTVTEANDSSVCALEPSLGSGRDYSTRYYYEPSIDNCLLFWYSGKEGNGNNFERGEDCLILCLGTSTHILSNPSDDCYKSPQKGPCNSYSTRWFYDRKSAQCRQFVFGGCYVNGNNFNSQQECAARCPPVCDQRPDAGYCSTYRTMWYYDTTTGRCQTFVYLGCGGNGNRFQTEWECKAAC